MGEPPEDLAGRLLRAASELLQDGGVDAVTIREVARRAEVSHGAPRRHFPTRQRLLAALAQAGFEELVRSLDALPPADAPDRLVEGARVYLELARTRPGLFDLMTRHDLLAGSGADLRSSSLAALGRWQVLVAAARPGATQQDGLLLFAAVHGVASLASHRALDVLGQDPADLLTRVLTAADGPPDAG